MEKKIQIDESRLNFPLGTISVGVLSSASVRVFGVPGDVTALFLLLDRKNETDPARVAGSRTCDGCWKVYCAPWCFPSVGEGLKFDVMASDGEGNPRWLGRGVLRVLECPSTGSSVVPPVVPPDTYVRNPVTGLYHLVTATVDEDGYVTLTVADEGVER